MQNLEISIFDMRNLEILRFDMQNLEISRFGNSPVNHRDNLRYLTYGLIRLHDLYVIFAINTTCDISKLSQISLP